MDRKLVLVLSFGLGLVALLLLQTWRTQMARELGLHGEPQLIVVAKTTLEPGTVLERRHLDTAPWPTSFAPRRRTPAALREDLLGRRVLHTLHPGEPLLTTDLDGSEEGLDRLAARIPPERRALALAVDRVSTFGGLLQPGDRVDVLTTYKEPDGGMQTKTLLQSVAVAAVGGRMGREEAAPGGARPARVSEVTLLVTAQEAELLIFAEKMGALSLTLRREADFSQDDDLHGISWLRDEDLRTVQVERRRRGDDCVTITTPEGVESVCN